CSFLFYDTPPPAFYTLSLHDALPILVLRGSWRGRRRRPFACWTAPGGSRYDRTMAVQTAWSGVRRFLFWAIPAVLVAGLAWTFRSEEHTSELQSRENLVCRLLLEKKK